MDSRDPSVRQLDALFDKLRPMDYYVAKVRKRMAQKRFPESDEPFTLVREVETATCQFGHGLATLTERSSRRCSPN